MRRLIYILTSLIVATLSIYPVSAYMGMHMNMMENTETGNYESMEQIMCGNQGNGKIQHTGCGGYSGKGMINMMSMYMNVFNPFHMMYQSIISMFHYMMM